MEAIPSLGETPCYINLEDRFFDCTETCESLLPISSNDLKMAEENEKFFECKEYFDSPDILEKEGWTEFAANIFYGHINLLTTFSSVCRTTYSDQLSNIVQKGMSLASEACPSQWKVRTKEGIQITQAFGNSLLSLGVDLLNFRFIEYEPNERNQPCEKGVLVRLIEGHVDALYFYCGAVREMINALFEMGRCQVKRHGKRTSDLKKELEKDLIDLYVDCSFLMGKTFIPKTVDLCSDRDLNHLAEGVDTVLDKLYQFNPYMDAIKNDWAHMNVWKSKLLSLRSAIGHCQSTLKKVEEMKQLIDSRRDIQYEDIQGVIERGNQHAIIGPVFAANLENLGELFGAKFFESLPIWSALPNLLGPIAGGMFTFNLVTLSSYIGMKLCGTTESLESYIRNMISATFAEQAITGILTYTLGPCPYLISGLGLLAAHVAYNWDEVYLPLCGVGQKCFNGKIFDSIEESLIESVEQMNPDLSQKGKTFIKDQILDSDQSKYLFFLFQELEKGINSTLAPIISTLLEKGQKKALGFVSDERKNVLQKTFQHLEENVRNEKISAIRALLNITHASQRLSHEKISIEKFWGCLISPSIEKEIEKTVRSHIVEYLDSLIQETDSALPLRREQIIQQTLIPLRDRFKAGVFHEIRLFLNFQDRIRRLFDQETYTIEKLLFFLPSSAEEKINFYTAPLIELICDKILGSQLFGGPSIKEFKSIRLITNELKEKKSKESFSITRAFLEALYALPELLQRKEISSKDWKEIEKEVSSQILNDYAIDSIKQGLIYFLTHIGQENSCVRQNIETLSNMKGKQLYRFSFRIISQFFSKLHTPKGLKLLKQIKKEAQPQEIKELAESINVSSIGSCQIKRRAIQMLMKEMVGSSPNFDIDQIMDTIGYQIVHRLLSFFCSDFDLPFLGSLENKSRRKELMEVSSLTFFVYLYNQFNNQHLPFESLAAPLEKEEYSTLSKHFTQFFHLLFSEEGRSTHLLGKVSEMVKSIIGDPPFPPEEEVMEERKGLELTRLLQKATAYHRALIRPYIILFTQNRANNDSPFEEAKLAYKKKRIQRGPLKQKMRTGPSKDAFKGEWINKPKLC